MPEASQTTTRPFWETVRKRAESDPAFAQALADEGVTQGERTRPADPAIDGEAQSAMSQTTPRMIVSGPLVQCWKCKQMRHSLTSVNVAPNAASGGAMMPLCEDCSASWLGSVKETP